VTIFYIGSGEYEKKHRRCPAVSRPLVFSNHLQRDRFADVECSVADTMYPLQATTWAPNCFGRVEYRRRRGYEMATRYSRGGDFGPRWAIKSHAVGPWNIEFPWEFDLRARNENVSAAEPAEIRCFRIRRRATSVATGRRHGQRDAVTKSTESVHLDRSKPWCDTRSFSSLSVPSSELQPPIATDSTASYYKLFVGLVRFLYLLKCFVLNFSFVSKLFCTW